MSERTTPADDPGLKMMRDRAARADMGAVLAILDKVPDVPPEPGDEMPEMPTGTVSGGR